MPQSFSSPRSRVGAIFLFIILIFVVSGSLGRGQSQTGKPVQQSPEAIAFPGEPAGSNRCVFCHQAQVEGYSRSAMAHSLRRAGQEPDGTVNANGSKITMHSSPSGYWQRWQNGADETEYRVDFVIGSGNHASGYLVNLGGHLFQSPVAFYRSRQSYDLAPGYEHQPDPDFTRPVSEECLLCHSGTALHIPGTLNQYRSPVFSAEAITCERCHGPSEKHIADPRPGTIVNPARLEPAARDSVCEQCHLFGIARVPNPGRKLSDFVPGQPLEDTFTIYHEANPSGAFKVISHAEQLALSVCARNSGGRLWCGTCHDPHDKPTQALEYYRSRCLSCHTAQFPASHPAKDSDCLGCHMPRRQAKDGGHTAFTDHRIQRRPATLPDAPSDTGIVAWREPPPDLRERNLGIAYIEVGMQRHSSSFIAQGYRDLTDVQQQFANDPDFFGWIGEALLTVQQTAEAKIALDRALQLDPDSALAESRAAAPYMQEGDTNRAIAHLERAVSLDPLDLAAASSLIGLYQKEGRAADSAELSSRIRGALAASSDSTRIGTENSAESAKKAEEVFKNIQVLKGTRSGQLIPAMQFISSSLGVECGFCHVEGHFEKDDKKPKQTARDMMRMMFALNQNSFANQREITCYSCHRGAVKPVSVPAISAAINSATNPAINNEAQQNSVAAASEAHAPTGALPTVANLIDGYIQALGGSAAIKKITSRVQKGTTQILGQSVVVEISTEAGKQTIVRHLPAGDSVTVFDGHAGWFSIAGHPVREMQQADIVAARMDADLQFPLHIQQLFPELRVQYPEKIGDREALVLQGRRPGEPAAEFYFDRQTGLLVRLVRYAESPLGANPTQIDYADYRPVDGVQVPFRVTISRPDGSSTIQMEDTQQNVLIDDARFAPPSTTH